MADSRLRRDEFAAKVSEIILPLQGDVVDMIDAWRLDQPDKPSPAAAINMLVVKALTTEGAH